MQLFRIVQIVLKIDRTDTKTQGWARARAIMRFTKHLQGYCFAMFYNV